MAEDTNVSDAAQDKKSGAPCVDDIGRDELEQPFRELPTSGHRADGTFAPGNVEALKHGLFSRRFQAGDLAEPEHVRTALADKRDAITSDLGGADAVSELQGDMVGRYVALQLVEAGLIENIIRLGVLTPKGRQRAALGALLQVGDRLTRIAGVLGV